MIEADVCVVGGGPGGAATATALARAGRDVVLVDKATFPRDKCCGDGLTAGALRRLEQLGLLPGAVASWRIVDDVWVRSPSGRTVRFPLPRGQGVFAAVARRFELDAAVLDLARAAGVKVHDGHGLIGASQDAGGVTLAVEGLGDVRARYAVGADGTFSPLARALGARSGRELGEFHAFRQYFGGVAEPAATGLWVFFEPDLLPGYAWSFPLPDGRANVGFGVPRRAGETVQRMKDQWPELLARDHVRAVIGRDAQPEAPHRAWPIPAHVDRAVLACGRALFVGDAAGGADPMTGEGIGQALEMAELAAEAMLAAGAEAPGAAARRYRQRVTAALVADHRMSMRLTRVLSHRKGARGAIRAAGLTPWTRRNFGRWLFEDYPRAMIVTPGRWHRGMFRGTGAYAH
ncbi:MAG: geranylgeranyl reductase family protein [Actinobacteria bacterium]|nr:MAG: geranylgeranyl reductase family protein [Actinomycetota bacterium]